ncbi:unnamed protein product [Arctogadus glacialis]
MFPTQKNSSLHPMSPTRRTLLFIQCPPPEELFSSSNVPHQKNSSLHPMSPTRRTLLFIQCPPPEELFSSSNVPHQKNSSLHPMSPTRRTLLFIQCSPPEELFSSSNAPHQKNSHQDAAPARPGCHVGERVWGCPEALSPKDPETEPPPAPRCSREGPGRGA